MKRFINSIYNRLLLLFIPIIIFFGSCGLNQKGASTCNPNQLKVTLIAPGVYQHTSFLYTKAWGKVPCNGMIVLDDGEAIIFDTPPDESTTSALIQYVEHNLNAKIKCVVATHFHIDCLGGLQIVHNKKIPSYAFKETAEIAKKLKSQLPQHAFDSTINMSAGNIDLSVSYFGPGHTVDNIVAYVPSANVLFGGCLIKALNAEKGNLADADTTKWSSTVEKIARKYANDSIIVIPGHGNIGNQDLLEYTVRLFKY